MLRAADQQAVITLKLSCAGRPVGIVCPYKTVSVLSLPAGLQPQHMGDACVHMPITAYCVWGGVYFQVVCSCVTLQKLSSMVVDAKQSTKGSGFGREGGREGG